jgi:hypothetical protein
MIDYGRRSWKGLPNSSSRTESTVNVPLNAGMKKLRQACVDRRLARSECFEEEPL